MCHRCFTPIPPPTRPPGAQKGAKALADKPANKEDGDKEGQQAQQEAEKGEGEQQQQQNGAPKEEEEGQQQAEEETPPAFDPCLPRYCATCAGKNAELDARCVWELGSRRITQHPIKMLAQCMTATFLPVSELRPSMCTLLSAPARKRPEGSQPSVVSQVCPPSIHHAEHVLARF